MIEYIDKHTIANEIAMTANGYSGSILMLEGPDDGRLFRKFLVGGDGCRIVIAHGKGNAQGALSLVRRWGIVVALLVVLDADFWHVTGDVPVDQGVLVTDFHDLEMMMLSSPAFEAVLGEFAVESKVNRQENLWGVSIFSGLLSEVGRVGLVRLVNSEHNLSLRFRSVDLSKFIEPATLEINLADYLEALIAASDGRTDLAEVASHLATRVVPEHQMIQVVCGHDFTKLLAIALVNAIGNCDPDSTTSEFVESLLRLAFGPEEFARTNLCAAIHNWESAVGIDVLAF